MPASPAGADARVRAARIVSAVIHRGRSLDRAIVDEGSDPENEPGAGNAGRDAALVRQLAYGTLRWHFRLDEVLGRLLDRPLRRRDAIVDALLRVGLYQLADTRVPAHAAVAATVDAVRAAGRPRLASLVNAVLRRAQRDAVLTRTPATPAARTEHPDWLVERLTADWPDDVDAIIAANRARAPMWLRVDARRHDGEGYRERLAAVGIEAGLNPGLPGALRLETPVAVDELPGFDAGEVSVQDGAAQLAAPWLLADGARRVLDACAAPGGKSLHLAELGGPDLDLTAIDSSPARLTDLAATLSRGGVDATVVAADASKPDRWYDGRPFDAILLDAPCSATGVIRRHPDIRLHRRATDIPPLQRLQRELLDALWPLLRPGGRLLYVTCSVLAAENDETIAGFAERTDNAGEIDLLPNNNIRDLMRRKAHGYQILPGSDDLDGFYYACLQKEP